MKIWLNQTKPANRTQSNNEMEKKRKFNSRNFQIIKL